MKIVGVAECHRRSSAIPIWPGKTDKRSKKPGVSECVVETQGTIGTEHKLTPAQIAGC